MLNEIKTLRGEVGKDKDAEENKKKELLIAEAGETADDINRKRIFKELEQERRRFLDGKAI